MTWDLTIWGVELGFEANCLWFQNLWFFFHSTFYFLKKDQTRKVDYSLHWLKFPKLLCLQPSLNSCRTRLLLATCANMHNCLPTPTPSVVNLPHYSVASLRHRPKLSHLKEKDIARRMSAASCWLHSWSSRLLQQHKAKSVLGSLCFLLWTLRELENGIDITDGFCFIVTMSWAQIIHLDNCQSHDDKHLYFGPKPFGCLLMPPSSELHFPRSALLLTCSESPEGL